MNRAGQPRRDAILGLVPRDRLVIDVGADHGHVAAALGAVATERMPHRTGRGDVRWVVADGLAPFREVPCAVIAGMGALTIAGILERGPRPGVAVLHAQDDPPRLRTWLAANGWRIDAEVLAPEAGRFAEILRAVPGHETASGLRLAYGPRLLEGHDPHLRAHLEHLEQYLRGVTEATEGRAPSKHEDFTRRHAFVASVLRERGWA